MAARVRVRKVGNSLGVILTKDVVESLEESMIRHTKVGTDKLVEMVNSPLGRDPWDSPLRALRLAFDLERMLGPLSDTHV